MRMYCVAGSGPPGDGGAVGPRAGGGVRDRSAAHTTARWRETHATLHTHAHCAGTLYYLWYHFIVRYVVKPILQQAHFNPKIVILKLS